MTLALRLGRTVGELLTGMTAAELMLWRAYDAEAPISDLRGDVQAALVASSVFQAQGKKVTLGDMMPQWGGRAEPVESDWAGFVGAMRGAV